VNIGHSQEWLEPQDEDDWGYYPRSTPTRTIDDILDDIDRARDEWKDREYEEEVGA
jgi:hypothetical protein